MLQYVTYVLQRVAAGCESVEHIVVEQSNTACCSVLQYATVCCSVLWQSASLSSMLSQRKSVQYVAIFCSMLQCVAVCCNRARVCRAYRRRVEGCSVLQCVEAERETLEHLVAE